MVERAYKSPSFIFFKIKTKKLQIINNKITAIIMNEKNNTRSGKDEVIEVNTATYVEDRTM